MTTTKDLKMVWSKADIKRREFEYEQILARAWSKVIILGGAMTLLVIFIAKM